LIHRKFNICEYNPNVNKSYYGTFLPYSLELMADMCVTVYYTINAPVVIGRINKLSWDGWLEY